MKDQPRMWLRFVYDDGSATDLEVGRFTTVKAGTCRKVRFHVDLLPDGKHLVLADESVLRVDDKRDITSKLKRDITSKLRRIEVLRSSEGQSQAGTVPTPQE